MDSENRDSEGRDSERREARIGTLLEPGIPKLGIPKTGIPKAGIPKLGIPKMGRFRAPLIQTPLRLPLNYPWLLPEHFATDFGETFVNLAFHSLVFGFYFVFCNQGNSLVFRMFSAVFLRFSRVLGVQRGQKSLLFWVVSP